MVYVLTAHQETQHAGRSVVPQARRVLRTGRVFPRAAHRAKLPAEQAAAPRTSSARTAHVSLGVPITRLHAARPAVPEPVRTALVFRLTAERAILSAEVFAAE
jgi:hypothetical protein